MDKLLRDVTYWSRSVRKHPGYALLIVICLALGIGVNSAIFSVVDSVLLRPLPYPDADRLAILSDLSRSAGSDPQDSNVSAPNYFAWKEQDQLFAQLTAISPDYYNLTGGEPERVQGAAVSQEFFSLLGAKPFLGRTFRAEECKPGGAPVVILSHGLWQRRFGGDPSILSHPMMLNGQAYTVVGILPAGFFFLNRSALWVPLTIDAVHQDQPRSYHYLTVAGKLKPGVSIAKAQAEMSAIAGRLERERPDTNTDWGVHVVSLRENLSGDFRRPLTILLAAVGFVLLIACANVGNLLLTRAMERQNEIAIRSALGAERRDLLRQILTESILLALLGGACGLALAALAVRVLPLISPADGNLFQGVQIDLRVLSFTLVISVLTGILPGLLSTVRTDNAGLYDQLKNGAKRATEGLKGRRLQSALVVAEIALATVLLACAGLMIRSFSLLSHINPGFDSKNVLVLQASLPDWRYPQASRIDAFWEDVIRRVRTIPGVISVGACNTLPVNTFAWTSNLAIEGRPTVPGETLVVNFRTMTPDFLRTLKVPLLAGRPLDEHDNETGLPVALISQEMAKRFWPGQSPLGKRFLRLRKVANNPPLTIVGVVGDVQDAALGSKLEPAFYLSLPQNSKPTMYLLVRTNDDPLRWAGDVRRAIQAVDRDQPVDEITTLDLWIARSLSRQRFNTFMLTLFAGLGTILAAVGIYGLLWHLVTRRSHEIGVRMALGAQTRDILTLVLGRGVTLTVIGLAIGIFAAFLSTRLLESLLYGVRPGDPFTFLSIVLGLGLVALCASYLPARRASRVDPIVSIKYD
ncbi:MAG TPA: ABC transporter permease [Thermoanaerobaculia bacterium]|nr:ABC transporter permease [Thermoanaerobaculia bacterium]